MPKVFDYLGFIFFFYSNDHLPIHCHVIKGNKEVKVELIFRKGTFIGMHIRMANRRTKKMSASERKKIRKFVEVHHREIREKWEDFRAGKLIRSRIINKEIK
jgi:hypothetical protein